MSAPCVSVPMNSFHSTTNAMPATLSESPQSSGKSTGIQFTLITAPTALTATLAALIQAQVSGNDQLPSAPIEDMTVFHALEPPAISVADYVARVSKFMFCSEACLVAAFHYIETAIRRDPNLALTSLSVHRLFITAVVLACKYFDDVSYNLTYYSKVGGLPCKELANLEIDMLRILDFRLDISAKKFAEIESRMMLQLSQLNESETDSTTHDLVQKATAEFNDCDIVPIDFELLTDEEPERNDEHRCRQVSPSRKLRASPATSAVTDDGCGLSRNSSLSSMPEQSQTCEESTSKSHMDVTSKDYDITNSPTTPGPRNCDGCCQRS